MDHIKSLGVPYMGKKERPPLGERPDLLYFLLAFLRPSLKSVWQSITKHVIDHLMFSIRFFIASLPRWLIKPV